MSTVYKRIQVAIIALYRVEGDHLPCAFFPQLFAAPPAPAGAWCQPRLVVPYVLVAPPARMPHFLQVPLQQMQDWQACSSSGHSDGTKSLFSSVFSTHNNHVQASSAPFDIARLDNMSEENIRKHVRKTQDTLDIPFWLRINENNLQLKKVKRYAKDLSIAPLLNEPENLYNGYPDGLIMSIHAMEDQNNVPDDDRKKIDRSLLSNKEQLIEYAKQLSPCPIFEDLETMHRGRLLATIIKMLRHLCMLVPERPSLEDLTVEESVSYGETLLAKYPREKFPSLTDSCGPALIKRLASVVHLPDATLQRILAMPTQTQVQIQDRYFEVKKMLASSYPHISFYSNTASRNRVSNWDNLKETTICLQTGFCNNEPERELVLSICRYTLSANGMIRIPSVRFSLQTTSQTTSQRVRTDRNVTQFMQVVFDYQGYYCILRVYDPVKEKSSGMENTRDKSSYFIPKKHMTKTHINQEQDLRNFLTNCATKIGEPIPYETVSDELTEQIYRACDPIPRKGRIARQRLLELLEGKEDVVDEMMAKTNNTD